MPDQTSFLNKTIFFLLCLTLVFTTLAYGGVHQPVLAVFYIFVSAIVIMFLADALGLKTIAFDGSLIQIPIFLAALYGFVQIVPFGSYLGPAGIDAIPRTISIDPFSSQVNAFHFLALALFFSVFLSSLNSTARIRTAAYVIVAFGFLFAFYAILQSVLSPGKIYGIYSNTAAAPFGSFINRNNFAAFMEMSVCLPLGMLYAGGVGRDKRLIYITAISLMGISLLLSGSRGGFVGMLTGVILIVLTAENSGGKRHLVLRVALVAALLIVLVGGAIFVGGEGSLVHFTEFGQDETDPTPTRLYMWGIALKIIAANMPFGAGLGAFGVAFTQFDTNGGIFRVEQAHNDYLQIAADAGIPGILIGGWFLFLLIRTGLRSIIVKNSFRRGVAIGSFAACCAMIVHSLFDFVLHTTAVSLLFLMLTGLVTASSRSYPDDSKRNVDP
jgi:O-antigen ligase